MFQRVIHRPACILLLGRGAGTLLNKAKQNNKKYKTADAGNPQKQQKHKTTTTTTTAMSGIPVDLTSNTPSDWIEDITPLLSSTGAGTLLYTCHKAGLATAVPNPAAPSTPPHPRDAKTGQPPPATTDEFACPSLHGGQPS